MNFYAFSSLINFITSICLSFVILSKDKRTKLDFLFIFFALSDSVWSFGYFFWQLSGTAEEALLWSRLFMAGAILIGLSYVYFIFEFLKKRGVARKIATVLFIIFFGLNFTPLVVSGVSPVLNFPYWPQPGVAFHAFLITWLGFVAYCTMLLFQAYRNASGVRRMHIGYLLLGLMIGFIGGGSNYFLWYGIPIPPLGNILVSIFVLSVFYAIVRYKFFNVRVIITELFVLALVLMSVIQFFVPQSTVVGALFIFSTLVAGSLLIRSVLGEVKQRDRVQALSEQLAASNSELKLINEAKTEFLSVASHQLRTPLTAIKGYASMLLENNFGSLTPEQNKGVKLIFDSSDRLSRLVADLLDVSRIESGRMEFDFEPVDLCKVAESVVEELSQKAKDKSLYLYFDNVHKACPQVRADEEKIRQVILNLVDNAIKYTVSGGVTVSLNQVDAKLRLSVRDTGIGIDPKEASRLFGKFYRTKEASTLTAEGTGLGIYVVKRIVESHGGKVWFESPGLEKGATFYVSLPVPTMPIKKERVRINSIGL